METDGLPRGRRLWAIAAISIAVVMSVLNTSIANVALPTLSHELQSDAAATIWVVNAFQLTLAIAILPFASLGDIAGYRRVYLFGLGVFTLAAALCGLCETLPQLIAARVLQGIGAAAILAVNVALVRFIYPQAQLGRGIGLNIMFVAVSAAAGPSVAAAILAIAPWQGLFFFNVPLGLLALAFSIPTLPRTEPTGHRFDAVSALFNAVAFGLFIIAMDAIGHGSHPAVPAALLAGAVLSGWALVRRELRSPMPLFPVDLFRNRTFALSAATHMFAFGTQGVAFVALPFFLYEVLGRSQVEVGLLLTPWPLTIALVTPIAARFAERIPAGIIGSLGLAILAIGLVLVAFMPGDGSAVAFVWRMVVCGFGFGLFQATNSRVIIASAPRARSGAASGTISTSRQIGLATGAAMVAVVFNLMPDGGGSAESTLIAALAGTAFALAGMTASLARLNFRKARRPPA